jgi:hypothetical protein
MGELPREDAPFDDVLRGRAGLRLSPPARELARRFVEGFNAADARRVSTAGLRLQTEASEEEGGDRLFRVRDGYDLLPESLARAFARAGARADGLRLGWAVTEVRWRAAAVEVRARGTCGGVLPPLRARAALVTVPLGVLKARPNATGAIAFEPALPPAKRAAIARLAMGRVVKVVVRLREALGAGPLVRVPGATLLRARARRARAHVVGAAAVAPPLSRGVGGGPRRRAVRGGAPGPERRGRAHRRRARRAGARAARRAGGARGGRRGRTSVRLGRRSVGARRVLLAAARRARGAGRARGARRRASLLRRRSHGYGRRHRYGARRPRDGRARAADEIVRRLARRR